MTVDNYLAQMEVLGGECCVVSPVKVAKHWKKVAKAETHPEKVLEVLKTLP